MLTTVRDLIWELEGAMDAEIVVTFEGEKKYQIKKLLVGDLRSAKPMITFMCEEIQKT